MSETDADQHGGETDHEDLTNESAAELLMAVRHNAGPALTGGEHRKLRAVEDYLMNDTEYCDEHENREAEHIYDDGTAWCEDCHVANVDAAAAAGREA